MCDYSLMALPNRLGRKGEELIVYRFPTGALGLASPADFAPISESAPEPRTFWGTLRKFFATPPSRCVTAVCIPPGANLILRDIPVKLQKAIGCASEECVTFTQTTSEVHSYRDAVRFSSGQEVRLQELHEGQRVEVLDLDMAREREPNLEEFAGSPVRSSW
jgi:hypothetical protein